MSAEPRVLADQYDFRLFEKRTGNSSANLIAKATFRGLLFENYRFLVDMQVNLKRRVLSYFARLSGEKKKKKCVDIPRKIRSNRINTFINEIHNRGFKFQNKKNNFSRRKERKKPITIE